MKIGHPADKPAPATAAGTPAPASETQKPAHGVVKHAGVEKSADASSTVALSNTASTLLAGGAAGEFDADKVARIGEQIAAGTYKVNPEAIADKLIANAQELLGKVKG